jgi:hypothetical protein
MFRHFHVFIRKLHICAFLSYIKCFITAVKIRISVRHAPRHKTQHAHPQYSIDSSIEHLSEGTRNAPWGWKYNAETCRSYSWFQIFAVFWILYIFFWVFPRRQIKFFRRFGTHILHQAFENGPERGFRNVGKT